jgi:hypothetical protein
MKHTKTVAVPATTKVVVDHTTCDLCQKRIVHNGYNVDQVRVEHRTGSQCSDGGSGYEVSVDICGSCFITKLLPYLESQGAKPTTEEWDW